MYKVLIVDDEMIVRVGLKSFIDWESFGFTLCGEANHGEEALALCERFHPELVLTDVRMPKMDGIEFIERSLQRWPGLKVVVLSCVNDFDVLQQALRFGVRDYFLKLSFNPDTLIEILNRIRGELDSRPNKGQGQVALQEVPYPEQAVFKENFYRIAVRDKQLVLRPDRQVRLGIRAGEHVMMMVSGDSPYSLGKRDPKLRGHLLKYSVINIIAEVLGREVPSDVVELDEDIYLAVLSVHERWEEATSLLLAREIQHSLLRFLNYSVSIGISGRRDCFQQFYTGYAESVAALEYRFYRGHGTVHFYQETRIRHNPQASPPMGISDENAIARDLEGFSFEMARSTVISYIAQAIAEEAYPPAEFRALFIEWVIPWGQMLKKYGGSIKEEPEVPLSPYELVYRLETLEDIKNWYLDYTVRMEELIRKYAKAVRMREEIEQAKRYVQKHYSEDISIVDVAGHIGLNSTYFSHLFKKENGEGFSEYLTRYRLSEAQRLLRETPKTINEISEEVGYNDTAYFRKIFRQQLQMTPSEYRAKFT